MSNICQVEKYFKAAALVDLVLPRMLELNTIQADDAAGVMMSVLQVRELSCNVLSQGHFNVHMYQAFQEMGHHEANNIALTHTALFCYERLRPRLKKV